PPAQIGSYRYPALHGPPPPTTCAASRRASNVPRRPCLQLRSVFRCRARLRVPEGRCHRISFLSFDRRRPLFQFFFQITADNLTHLALLRANRLCAVDHSESKFADHVIIFVQNLSLEDLKTLFFIVCPVHIHSRFVVFQLRARGSDAIDGHIKRRAKKERRSRLNGKFVNLAYPGTVTAARY